MMQQTWASSDALNVGTIGALILYHFSSRYHNSKHTTQKSQQRTKQKKKQTMTSASSFPSFSTSLSGTTTLSVQPPPTWEEIKMVDANQQCIVSRKKSELGNGGLKSILSFFQSACGSDEFFEKCDKLGLRDGAFSAITLSKHGHPTYEKFSQALSELPNDAVLGVCFHGTQEQNVDSIIMNGLDPKKRAGQVYGPGEYFATNPQISISYCRGGHEMIVFLVVVPKRDPSTRYPSNFVVVKNNSHQIPLGTILFDSVDRIVMQESRKLRNKLQSLSETLDAKQLKAEETRLKAEIMQKLMTQEMEKASNLYQENMGLLGELSKREIAWYVHPFFSGDSRAEALLFPNLPPPLQAAELKKADVTSVEMSDHMQSRAQREFERTTKLVAKKEEIEAKQKSEAAKMKEQASTDANPLENKQAEDTKEKEAVECKPLPCLLLDSIMHDVANKRIDMAAERYMQKEHLLDGFSKRLLAECVARNVEDPKIVPLLFPYLPDV